MPRMKESLLKDRGHKISSEEKDHYSSSDESSSSNAVAMASRKRGKRGIFAREENKAYGLVIDEIMGYYFNLNDLFRALTFSHAAKCIREYPHVITSSEDALMINGVGKAIANIFDELKNTGKVERLEILRSGILPKEPRKAFKKISNFPQHEHEHPHKQKIMDLVENPRNKGFCDHLQTLVDLYMNHVEDKDMIHEGLKLNRYVNRIREEAHDMTEIFHDARRYKKIKTLYDEFSKSGSSELYKSLSRGDRVFLPKLK